MHDQNAGQPSFTPHPLREVMRALTEACIARRAALIDIRSARWTVHMTTRDNPQAIPRLRFDKVAVRLTQGVSGALNGAVPDGLCVIFTVTAPIREPSKTLIALTATIRTRLSLEDVLGELTEVLYGNEVRVRVVASRLPHAAKTAGFVHNPDSPPSTLLNMAQSLLEGVEAADLARNFGLAPNVEALQRLREQLLDAEHRPPAAAAR